MMKFRLLATICVIGSVVAGCAGMVDSIADSGNEIRVREDSRPAPNARQEKYPITIRLTGYVDARKAEGPRWVGVSTSRILGMSGKDIVLDRDVTEVVTESAKKHLGDDGMSVLSGDVPNAQFQLSGSVKELGLNVKERDYVSIAIESTLTELTSGKVIWSGVVVEKADRFAGVSGNNKKDVADYLRKELGIAMGKTSESILSVLMATRPDMFNMVTGIKPVQGVTVFSNSTANIASAVAPAIASSELVAVNGTLSLKTVPSRAKVYVDGVYFGLTPLRVEIDTGVRDVSVKLDGYQTASEKVSIRRGDTTILKMKLQH
jgi:hypothetical protein